jgi:SAM-dependent methyltransferase
MRRIMRSPPPVSSAPSFETIGACPACRGALSQTASEVFCAACGERWPVVEGVPRFVSAEHYTGTFGFQWRRYRTTQIEGAAGQETEETFAAKTGLTPEAVRGKVVLDVGVGAGRFSDVVARWGGYPVGVDLSQAVLTARETLARYDDRGLVAQADLFNLPFREASFDIVFSIGVIHHTPSTRAAFRAIAPLVKPGGVLAVAVYRDDPGNRFSDRYRRYTTALSTPTLHALAQLAGPNYYLLQALERALGTEYAAWLKSALRTVEHPSWEWRVLDTFDWYAPRYQWKHTAAEVCGWFRELGFEGVEHLPEPTMVSVRGRRGPGPLPEPPATSERRAGEVPPLPVWVPGRPPLRDPALLALLAAEVGRAIPSATVKVAREEARRRLTRAVIRCKRLLGLPVQR